MLKHVKYDMNVNLCYNFLKILYYEKNVINLEQNIG